MSQLTDKQINTKQIRFMVRFKFISLFRITPVPAGQFAVVTGYIEDPATMYDKAGMIKRSLWDNVRIFKRKGNAERYQDKLKQKGWNEFLVTNRIINLN